MKSMRKMLFLVLSAILTLTLFACGKEITLTSDNIELTLSIGESQTLVYETNDEENMLFSSSDEQVVTVDADGTVTAVSEGNAVITITSASDSEKKLEINITVQKPNPESITISGEQTVIIGNEVTLTATVDPNVADQGIVWSSNDEQIASVSESGVVTAVTDGVVTIQATSVVDSSVFAIFEVTVQKPDPTSITITGENLVDLGANITLSALVDPSLADQGVTWSSSDDAIAVVDQFGLVTGVTTGDVTITATSSAKSDITATFVVTVYDSTIVADTFVVDQNSVAGSVVKFNGVFHVYGTTLFSNIQSAIDAADYDKTIFVLDGTYSEDITIAKDGISLIGPNADLNPNSDTRVLEAILTGTITIGDGNTEYSKVTIKGFKFTDSAKVTAPQSRSVNSFEFMNNLIENINYTGDVVDEAFLEFDSTSTSNGIKNITIKDNKFESIKGHSKVRPIWLRYVTNIEMVENVINDFEGDIRIQDTTGVVNVLRNTISNNNYRGLHIVSYLDGEINVIGNHLSYTGENQWAISIWGLTPYEAGTKINVHHNVVENVDKGIMVDAEYKNDAGAWVADKEIKASAHYNIVRNYNLYAAYSSDAFIVDFSDNYWGTDTPDIGKFYNLGESDITNYYKTEESVPTPEELEANRPFELLVQEEVYVSTNGSVSLLVKANPSETSNESIFVSSDESVAMVNEAGVITGVAAGTAEIKVYSLYDSKVYKTVSVIVTDNFFVVDKTATTDSTKDYNGKTLNYGTDLFSTIQSAIDAANGETFIYVLAGEYSEDITIAKDNIRILGPNYNINPNETRVDEAVLTGTVTIGDGSKEFSNITISGFNFTGTSQVLTNLLFSVNNFTFSYNIVKDIAYSGTETIAFLHFDSTSLSYGAKNVLISNNKFENVGGYSAVRPIWLRYTTGIDIVDNYVRNIESDIRIQDSYGMVNVNRNDISETNYRAIHITSFLGGTVNVLENVVSYTGANQWAIALWGSSPYEDGMTINVHRNVVENVDKGIMVDAEYKNDAGAWVADKEVYASAHNNIVKNYSIWAAYSSDAFIVDFTNNYWGVETPDIGKFLNLTLSDIEGYFSSEDEIPGINKASEILPKKVEITTTVTSIESGSALQIEAVLTPNNVDNPSLTWISSDTEIAVVTQGGLVTALKSGTVTITAQSVADTSIEASIEIDITLNTGIEITSDNTSNNLVVGDNLTLTSRVFPDSESSRGVTWTSSDETVATVDQFGVVTTLKEGVSVITATLSDDNTISTSYTVQVFSSLDSNNLLDLLTMNQFAYSSKHNFTAYGFSFDYDVVTYDSVSKYYFGDIGVTEKIIPVTDGIRPGEGMAPIPDGVTSYNDYNLHWVVVHDTANTSASAGAESHANYLMNSATSGTKLWTSWHFTVDDTIIYQHLPETERSYHAGDGSKLVGEGDYLGGGNRNGIGIEMSVNQGSDIYETWQKTAKHAANLLIKYNLPVENQVYHNDMSGKDCPKTLRNAGLIPLFEEFVAAEYNISKHHSDAEITFTSNNTEYLDNTGRIIKLPNVATTISYDISVTENGVTNTRTFYTYLPGLITE